MVERLRHGAKTCLHERMLAISSAMQLGLSRARKQPLKGQGLKGQGPRVRVFAQHHKLAQQERPADGRFPVENCLPQSFLLYPTPEEKVQGRVQRSRGSLTRLFTLFTGAKGRAWSQGWKF